MLPLSDPLTAIALDDVVGGTSLANLMDLCKINHWMCQGPFSITIMPIPYPLQPIRA